MGMRIFSVAGIETYLNAVYTAGFLLRTHYCYTEVKAKYFCWKLLDSFHLKGPPTFLLLFSILVPLKELFPIHKREKCNPETATAAQPLVFQMRVWHLQWMWGWVLLTCLDEDVGGWRKHTQSIQGILQATARGEAILSHVWHFTQK